MATAAQQDPGAPDTSPMGGLGAMRAMIGGTPMAGQDQLDNLINKPIIDPSNKWLHFAAAMSSPAANGSFAGELSGGLSALAGSQDHEAELRAKYAPVIAQALLQRQLQQFTMLQNQHKLLQEFDGTLTGGLTGLLSDPAGVTHDKAVGTISNAVMTGQVPVDFARQYAAQLPTDPAALTAYIKSRAVGQQSADTRLGAVSPKIELPNTGGELTPTNTNPNSGATPVGALPNVPTVPTTLTPKDKQPEVVSTPTGPYLGSKQTGRAAPLGSAGAGDIAAEANPLARGAGLPPAAPPSGDPSQPPDAGVPSAQPSAVIPLDEQAASRQLGDNFAKYSANLNTRVDASRDIAQRLQLLTEATQKFRSGATAGVRMEAGAVVKDVLSHFGVSSEQAATLANKIAGGDVPSMQLAQKLAAQGAMEGLRAAMGPGQRATQAEYAVFLKNIQNPTLDPNTIEKLNNFALKQYKMNSAEQDYVLHQRNAGASIGSIEPGWNKEYQRLYGNQQAPATGVGMGTYKTPGANLGPARVMTDTNGEAIKEISPGNWVYVHR